MRDEASFLKDIVAACRKIETALENVPEESFLRDEILTAAILHHLTIIGEAITRLPAGLKERWPEIAWKQIAAVRNRIVHAYFDLDRQILWDAANSDIPTLRCQIENIITAEFPEG